MPVRYVRRIVWIVIGLLVLAMAGSLALSGLAGRTLLQSTLIQSLNEMTGRRVTLDGPVRISVFPDLAAELDLVRISDWSARSDDPPLLMAERMVLRLAPRAALRGIVDIEGITLTRPVITLPVMKGAVTIPPGGRIWGAIAEARRMLAQNPEEVRFANSRGLGPGSITLIDGRLGAQGEDDALTGLNGSVTWNGSNDQLSLSLDAVWRGERLQLTGKTSDAVHLAAGRTTPLQFALTSAPAELSFDGAVTLKPTLFLDGNGTLAMTSGMRASQWIGIDSPLSRLAASVNLRGSLRGSKTSWSLGDAEFEFDKTSGRGALNLVTDETQSTLSGSLALDELDLSALTALMSPMQLTDAQTGNSSAGSGKGSRVAVDLRLSAARAAFGSFVFTDVAASVQQRDAMTAFDINNAEIYGGTLQLAVRSNQSGTPRTTELRILAEDIDGAAMAVAMPQLAMMPSAPLTASMILHGDGQTLTDFVKSADGSLSVRSGSGRINGMTLATLVSQVRKAEFFQLKPVPGISSPLKVLEAKANVTNGEIRFEKATIRPDDTSEIRFQGLASLSNQDLALVGTIELAPLNPLRDKTTDNTGDDAPEILTFFMGGGVQSVFVSPVINQPPSATDVP